MQSKSRYGYAGILLSIAVAAFIAANARAAIVYFENPEPGEPGHFDWRMGSDLNDSRIWLDVTRPSTDQSGTSSPSSVSQFLMSGIGETNNRTWDGAEIGISQFVAEAFEPGELIDAQGGLFGWWERGIFVNDTGGGKLVSEFSTRDVKYIGVLFRDVQGNTYFGWISAIRGGSTGMELTTFGWAYESEPGKSIVAGEVPAPGVLPGLALVTVVVGKRRRRAGDDRPCAVIAIRLLEAYTGGAHEFDRPNAADTRTG